MGCVGPYGRIICRAFIAAVNRKRDRENGNDMKYAIVTLGCKVNQFETQAMEAMLRARGHVPAAAGEADVVIVNSCAVTAESGRKSRQALRRLLAENPNAVGALCGCYSQIEPEAAKAIGASVVYGSGDRTGFVEAVERAASEKKAACAAVRLPGDAARSGGEAREGEVPPDPVSGADEATVLTNIDDPFRRKSIEPLPAGALEGRTRAYLKIEDGCDNFCSYCVIPYARGRVRSMALADIRAEAARLQGEGFRELIVTGIEIASYGKDLRDGSRLADALCAVSEAAPDARVRIGSLEPTVVTPDFCARLQKAGNICRHFHLSLQSGCDRVLAAMRRKYDTARFRQSAEWLREAFPGCALTADLIVGFPGETEEDFAQTLDFIRGIGFAEMHVFPYSPRPGTKAAAMPDQLTHAVKNDRAARAQRCADEMQLAFLDAQVGKTLPVLFETRHGDLWQGHSDHYCEVLAPGENLHGIMENVQISARDGKKLVGNIV